MLWGYTIFLRNTGNSFQNMHTDRQTYYTVVIANLHPSHLSVSPITSHVNACAGMNNILTNNTESKTELLQTFPFHRVSICYLLRDTYFNTWLLNVFFNDFERQGCYFYNNIWWRHFLQKSLLTNQIKRFQYTKW